MSLSNDKILTELLIRVQLGEQAAYEKVVQRFQAMAVGYGYSLLGDLQLAEDVAQEAFIRAYYDLPKLRDLAAFPGWFRRIVFTQINRVQRAQKVTIVPLDLALATASDGSIPIDIIEQVEVRNAVVSVVATLPEHQRTVVMLFYINEYSQKEISAFLEIPVATVKTRLHAARKQLKERMIQTLQETLIDHRPSKNETFIKEINMNLVLAKVISCRSDGCQVRLLETDELIDTDYSSKVLDNIKIRPEQIVVIHKGSASSQTLYRLFLAQITEINGNQVTVELMRDEGDRGKGRYHEATIADGLDLNLSVGDDVYGYNTIYARAANGKPAHPSQLLAMVSPRIEEIYADERF